MIMNLIMKSILPVSLWCALGWFWAKGEVHFPFLGLVTKEERPVLFFGLLLLDLLAALFFTISLISQL